VLLDVVVDELTYRAAVDSLAAAASNDLGWLGPPAASDRFVDPTAVMAIQKQVADGRVLRDPYEHLCGRAFRFVAPDDGAAS